MWTLEPAERRRHPPSQETGLSHRVFVTGLKKKPITQNPGAKKNFVLDSEVTSNTVSSLLSLSVPVTRLFCTYKVTVYGTWKPKEQCQTSDGVGVVQQRFSFRGGTK